MIAGVPVFVTVVTVIIGFLTYLFQKLQDRKEDLIKTRRIEYRKWLVSLYDVMDAEKPGALLAFNTSTNDLFLYASDPVVRSVGSFKRYMSITSGEDNCRDMKKVGSLLAKVVQEMRRDVFVATKLGEDEIRNILPIQGTADDAAR